MWVSLLYQMCMKLLWKLNMLSLRKCCFNVINKGLYVNNHFVLSYTLTNIPISVGDSDADENCDVVIIDDVCDDDSENGL